MKNNKNTFFNNYLFDSTLFYDQRLLHRDLLNVIVLQFST